MDASTYLNLDIIFHRDGEHYKVRAHNSVGNESSRAQPFTIPFTSQERELLTGDLPDAAHLTPQQVGQRLYNALFQGEIHEILARSDEQARVMAGLRLRLHMNDAPALALLPWEYLYDSTKARFLALIARLSIVRYLASGEPLQTLRVNLPLRVLVVLANPTSVLYQLNVEAEWQQLQVVFGPLVEQGIVELVRLPLPTRDALADHLEQYPVHVLHFVGHGDHDPVSGESGLYLVNEAGEADFVPASVLQVLLADARDRRNALRLAFLNACLSGRSVQIDPFAGTAQQLVQHGVPAVIAMQYSVTDDAATHLARHFYRALARGNPVDTALAEARKRVYIEGNSLDWGTPVLFMRAPDGRLFIITIPDDKLTQVPESDLELEYNDISAIDIKNLRERIESLRQDLTRGQITISIPGDINNFTSKELGDLVTAISTAANIDPEEIFIQNISSGSVRVTLELSQEAAQKFVYELEQKHPELEPHSIKIEHKFQLTHQLNDKSKSVILCLAAEPTDAVWLQLGKEHREIFESLNRAIYGHNFVLQQIWAAKARDVLRYLLYYKPAIVHFSGHGVANGALLFEDSEGNPHRVEPHALSGLFKGLNGDTRCVVLNSCYSHIQAKQISCHVDCVVGIEGEIENTSALAFASSFYEAIASGRSVKDAYILAQAELLMENLSGSEQVRLIWSENVNPTRVKFVTF